MGKTKENRSCHVCDFYKKHKQIILYVIFGGLTTVVDLTVSFWLYYVTSVHIANITAWIAAVIFAYVVNKIWVFESKTRRFADVISEIFAFCGGRVFSLLLQEGIFIVFVDILTFDKVAIKIVSSVIVVITNYILSKLVFKNGSKKTEREKKDETEL